MPSPTVNYYSVTYASVFGDDPGPAVNALAKQVKAGTGGFITGAAAIDGVATAISRAKSTQGIALATQLEKFQERPDAIGARELHAKPALGLRPPVPRDRIQDNKAQVVGTVVAKVVPEDLGKLGGVVETKTTDGRRPGDTLRAAAVSRSFQGVQALAGVDLELHDHEVVGLIGPNGAGKSTLVNLLTGFDRADKGTVELTARRDPLEPRPPRPGGPHPDLPAQPRVPRPLGPRERRGRGARNGASPRDAHERADVLLAGLGLTRYADAPAANLPHGHERSLGVARALATRPRFVLMDEPAAGLPEAEVPAFAELSAPSATSTAPACS